LMKNPHFSNNRVTGEIADCDNNLISPTL